MNNNNTVDYEKIKKEKSKIDDETTKKWKLLSKSTKNVTYDKMKIVKPKIDDNKTDFKKSAQDLEQEDIPDDSEFHRIFNSNLKKLKNPRENTKKLKDTDTQYVLTDPREESENTREIMNLPVPPISMLPFYKSTVCRQVIESNEFKVFIQSRRDSERKVQRMKSVVDKKRYKFFVLPPEEWDALKVYKEFLFYKIKW